MSTASHNNLKLGRVASTKSNSPAIGCPPGTWVVIVQGPYSPTCTQAVLLCGVPLRSGHAGEVPVNVNKKYVDVICYASQEDAYM